ncbi:hypothetical protein [Sphingobium sp.]|uniref:hypothetical protein n=1 Tax=Sphingobium sp. TaxID=1912891 RepID=UPI002E235511
MTISVTFPDGSIRDVPSVLRRLSGANGRSAFRNEPLDCSDRWRFVAGAAGWIARPRLGGVALMGSAPADEWWRSVAVMADRPAGLRAA